MTLKGIMLHEMKMKHFVLLSIYAQMEYLQFISLYHLEVRKLYEIQVRIMYLLIHTAVSYTGYVRERADNYMYIKWVKCIELIKLLEMPLSL